MEYFLNQQVGIVHISSQAEGSLLRTRARQLSSFMAGVQNFYTQELGLKRIDTDPPPNPNDPKDVNWRVGRLRASGPVQDAGLMYIGAFALENGKPSARLDGLKGLLVLSKVGDRCGFGRHTPTAVLELDVVKGLRGRGLGAALLRFGARDIHPQDDVVLDVAAPNRRAQHFYERYGFRRDNRVEPIWHGVFDTYHFRYKVSGKTLRKKLGP